MRSLRLHRPRFRPRRSIAAGAAGAVCIGLVQIAAIATPAEAAVSCSVDYKIENSWSTGFQGGVTFTNHGDALSSWSLTWTFANGQKITQAWSTDWSQSGSKVTMKNNSWNGNVPSGGTASFGFLASLSGSANDVPTDFAINGTRCRGANQPPEVRLTAPENGATVSLGKAVALQASASDEDGTVAEVEFYADDELISSDTTSPYTASWTPEKAGTVVLTAKATDDKGESTTSDPVTVTVSAGPSVVASPASVSLVQGESATVAVKLSEKPSSSVSATASLVAGASDFSIDKTKLTFTTSNWSTAQNITVSASDASEDATGTMLVSAQGWAPALVDLKVVSSTGGDYEQKFLQLYDKLHDSANGYFSPEGVPYHSVETLMVEAPDHGHATTSEAMSYYQWVEAEYGRITGDWAPYNKSWEITEKYIIPSNEDQPTNSFYKADDPATYAPESPNQEDYPAKLDDGVAVGKDPIAGELKSAYGTSDIYGMHWLLDVDNTYGFGRCGDGKTKPAYFNTYQRGSSESVWETIPQPSCDNFAFGGKNGYLDLFTGDQSYAEQWKYTNAPDADARAVQAAYWALKWSKAQGKQADVKDSVAKAVKMGDYLRYAMFDKYFKKIGDCTSPSCPAGTGKDASHYLMSWYYAWGGALDTSAGWAWRIGDGANHQGYQNPLAAYALSKVTDMKPKSSTGQADWAKSLTRQLEFYQWLQSAEGGIAGGATNSWDGQYGKPPADASSTFYGMHYDWQPVWHDPPSNRWFGFQTWSMERVAAYYYETGDSTAKKILDKWVPWALKNSKADGKTFEIPSDMTWKGQPEPWTGTAKTNSGLHVTVDTFSQDVGVAGSLVKTMAYYAAKSGDSASKTFAKNLLDALWLSQDEKGVVVDEVRKDYDRFDDKVVVPSGWSGKMPNGDKIDSSSTFISIRSFYKKDPDYPKVEKYLKGGEAPTMRYHRFWAQADVATALGVYSELFEK